MIPLVELLPLVPVTSFFLVVVRELEFLRNFVGTMVVSHGPRIPSSEDESTIRSFRSSCCEAVSGRDCEEDGTRWEAEAMHWIGCSFTGPLFLGRGTVCLDLETVALAFGRRFTAARVVSGTAR